MNTIRVLALLPLFIVLAHSFSWDFIVGGGKRLKFYYNGTVTHIEDIPSAHSISAVTYDPVHSRVLFIDYHDGMLSIYSLHLTYDLKTKKMQTLVMRESSAYYKSLAYDPLTQLLFWTEDKKMYSLSLKSASSNEAVDGNFLLLMYNYSIDIAVDSCGGYIYWATREQIERAKFDGSEREVVIDANGNWRRGLAIDQQTKTMYWIDEITYFQYRMESADLNGKNRRTFYLIGTESYASGLVVSKDFIYWRSDTQRAILQLPKHQQHGVAPVVYLQSSPDCIWCQLTAAKYTIEEQTLGNKSCEALKSLTLDVEERHDSICHNYCFQGNCSISGEGHPKCRCNAGYSGERCEVNACHDHCLNNGDCYLNEAGEPVCRCLADYGGDRCEYPTVLIKCIQTVSMLREILSADATSVTLSKGVKSTCAATAV